MIGPIRGARLPAEIKLQVVRAVHEAADAGMSVRRACEVLMLEPRRLRRWIRGQDRAAMTEADLIDRPPVARCHPHALLAEERVHRAAAAEDELAQLRHRKLAHALSRQARVFCSESSVLRELRSAGLVPAYQRRSRPARPRPVTDESEPNRTWRYDITTLPTLQGDYHLVPVLDACSRKIVGRHFSPEATSEAVQSAWGKALAAEGLLGADGPGLPAAASDRGTQMTSRSTRAFFFDLGVLQSFSRPRTPTDNATAESWMATLKCERLYEADTGTMTPADVESMIDRFITYYNEVRLHQSLDYVTPAERHDRRHIAIVLARVEGMQRARTTRMVANRWYPASTSSANEALRGSQRAVSRRDRRTKMIGPCS
ncbi:MAG: IS3 family transposase [Actinomycetota bacterium]|nr:IS3 family transposase [Actinomycetota bacterium]